MKHLREKYLNLENETFKKEISKPRKWNSQSRNIQTWKMILRYRCIEKLKSVVFLSFLISNSDLSIAYIKFITSFIVSFFICVATDTCDDNHGPSSCKEIYDKDQ